jgi:hypothetical protein
MHAPEAMPVLAAKEARCPLWAYLAPAVYLACCALCIRAIALDPSADVGIYGMLVAIGLVPAFVVPGVFSTRSVKLSVSSDGLLVDGRLVPTDDVRLAFAERGSAHVHVEERGGKKRSFLVASYKEAQALVRELPPSSAPSLGLSI